MPIKASKKRKGEISMTLRFVLTIRRVNDNLFQFMDEIHSLCNQKKDFTIGFKGGHNLYLETCKGLRKDAYICIGDEKKEIAPVIACINYAFALQGNCSLSLEDSHLLFFDITAYNPNQIKRIKVFADSLEVEVIES